ncbi:uncharacterized protein TNCV_4747411, partial [Trichonephila clavipes]
KRYALANNPFIPGFNKHEEESYIIAVDANNLYGYAISQPLPIGHFFWLTKDEVFEITTRSRLTFLTAEQQGIPDVLEDNWLVACSPGSYRYSSNAVFNCRNGFLVHQKEPINALKNQSPVTFCSYNHRAACLLQFASQYTISMSAVLRLNMGSSYNMVKRIANNDFQQDWCPRNFHSASSTARMPGGIPCSSVWLATLTAVPLGLGLNPGEDMDVCNCIVPSRHGVLFNSCRAASPPVRLVEGEERWEASDHPQGDLPLNWGETELNRSVTCMALKATDIDRRHLALCHDEFRGP